MRNIDGKMDSAKELRDQQHKSLADKVDQISSAIKWAGGLIVTILLSVLGWSVLQQLNANEAQKNELASQLKILQEGERVRELSAENRVLTTSAAETAAASDAIR